MSNICRNCGHGMSKQGHEQFCYSCIGKEYLLLKEVLKDLYREEYPADMQFFEADYERYVRRELQKKRNIVSQGEKMPDNITIQEEMYCMHCSMKESECVCGDAPHWGD